MPKLNEICVGISQGFHGLTSFENIKSTIKQIPENNLNYIEFGFQRCTLNWSKGKPGAPFPNQDICSKLRTIAQESNLIFSIHAPYSIVTTSYEPGKTQFAKASMTATAKAAHTIGATHITFHCGSRGPGRRGLERSKIILKEMIEVRNDRNISVDYCPEVAGKVNSLGSFHEILELAEHCNTLFTWDIAHDFARGGHVTSFDSIQSRFTEIESRLDISSHRRLPIHISGIFRTSAGEKSHAPLGKGDGVPWKLFLSVLKQNGFTNLVSIACESKALEQSAEWKRTDDAKKIRDFVKSDEIVSYWTPPKPALDAFLKD